MKTPPKTHCPLPTVIVLPRDIDQATIAGVVKAGYLPILTDYPESVKVIMPGSEVISNDLTMSALHAIDKTAVSDCKTYFVKELHARLVAREAGATKA